MGTPDGLEMFETIVGGCIAHNIPPSDMIAKIKHKESNEAVVKRPGEIDMLDVVTSFTQSFHKADGIFILILPFILLMGAFTF